MNIDFCVAINGNSNAYILTKLLFETFFRYVNTSELSIHVIDKGVDEQTLNYLNNKKETSPCPFTIYQSTLYLRTEGPEEKSFFNTADDTAKTAEWMIENCGTAKWCIIAHADLDFNGDIIQFLSPHMTDQTGQVSDHSIGIVAYNRTAYQQCFTGFNSISSFLSVPIDDSKGECKIMHGADPRRNGRGIPVRGWDVGELYILEVQAHGWGFVPLDEHILNPYVFHIRGGSGHNNNDHIQDHIRSQAINRLKTKGVN